MLLLRVGGSGSPMTLLKLGHAKKKRKEQETREESTRRQESRDPRRSQESGGRVKIKGDKSSQHRIGEKNHRERKPALAGLQILVKSKRGEEGASQAGKRTILEAVKRKHAAGLSGKKSNARAKARQVFKGSDQQKVANIHLQERMGTTKVLKQE